MKYLLREEITEVENTCRNILPNIGGLSLRNIDSLQEIILPIKKEILEIVDYNSKLPQCFVKRGNDELSFF